MTTVLHLSFDSEMYEFGVIMDASPFRRRVTLAGDAVVQTLVKRFGSGALRLDGAGDYVQFADSADFGFGSSDFTVEAWINFSSLSGDPYIFHFWRDAGNRWALQYMNTTDKFSVYRSVGYASQSSVTSSALGLTAGGFHHVAICRVSGSTAVYLDGVRVIAPQSLTGMAYTSAAFYLGSAQPTAASNYLNGYVDDLRVDNGVALYTAAFTPPGAIPYDVFPLRAASIRADNYLSAFPIPAQSVGQIGALTGTQDTYYGGDGKIVGTTKNTPSAPVSRRVRLHESRSGHLIREGWSDAAGNYSFTHLSRDYSYYVVGFDHTDQYQGVVADKLVPEVM